jgi:hypothetical protein
MTVASWIRCRRFGAGVRLDSLFSVEQYRAPGDESRDDRNLWRLDWHRMVGAKSRRLEQGYGSALCNQVENRHCSVQRKLGPVADWEQAIPDTDVVEMDENRGGTVSAKKVRKHFTAMRQQQRCSKWLKLRLRFEPSPGWILPDRVRRRLDGIDRRVVLTGRFLVRSGHGCRTVELPSSNGACCLPKTS